MRNGRPKYLPRMSKRLVESTLGNIDHCDQSLARIKQDNPQNLLIEKLHIRAGTINRFRAVECFRTRVLTLGDCRHRERSNQRLGLTAREELKELLNRSTGQGLD